MLLNCVIVLYYCWHWYRKKRCLRICLDEYFNWETHVNQLYVILVKANAMLSKIQYFVNETSLWSIYFAFFNSHLCIYCLWIIHCFISKRMYFTGKCSTYTVKSVLTTTFLKWSPVLKAYVHYFHQIFIFSPNDSPSKTVKNAFYVIWKGLFILKIFKFLYFCPSLFF